VRIFVCSVCGESKPYYAKDMCVVCYRKCYYQRPEVKERLRKYYSQPKWKEHKKKYDKEYSKKRRIYNPEKIKNVCLNLGYSNDVATAIALDGIILDKAMKERGIVK